jgi:hypothetical protein
LLYAWGWHQIVILLSTAFHSRDHRYTSWPTYVIKPGANFLLVLIQRFLFKAIWIVILQISASRVTGIIEMSHHTWPWWCLNFPFIFKDSFGEYTVLCWLTFCQDCRGPWPERAQGRNEQTRHISRRPEGWWPAGKILFFSASFIQKRKRLKHQKHSDLATAFLFLLPWILTASVLG